MPHNNNNTEDQLAVEWRLHVSKRLEDLHAEQSNMQKQINQIMLNTSTNEAQRELDKRVRTLELFQVRVMAALFVVQLIAGILWAVLSKTIFK